MTTQTLYRPVGQAEYDLIAASAFRRFPPRLPEQPIFYPVLTEPYAHEIARDWNTKEPTGIGYVTAFDVASDVVARYEPQRVGAAHHTELWVPAEDLDGFNDAIIGEIRIIATYRRGA
ncbi:MAG TPA: hypothetical protein VMA36_19065 [Candidatus Limnocylindria bacterium]|jgi:hypothetical protein|nr:hypothetical protein [Candidatus Limnocylindria bacterium]